MILFLKIYCSRKYFKSISYWRLKLTYYVGLDAGSVYCKLVIIDEEKNIKAKLVKSIEGSPNNTSKQIFKEGLKDANIKKKHITKIISLGRNRKKIPYKTTQESEILMIASGATHFIPELKTIVDLGALTNKAIKLNDEGEVIDYVINDKCASGSGIFLELVSKALEMDSIDELGEKAALSKNPIAITSQCSIFAESEVIYLVNEGKDELDIAAGVSNSIANRIYSQLKRVQMEKEIALTGGVANNIQIKNRLEERLGFKLKDVPINPIYIAAFGAALSALEK
ncbi:MAG: hypothetical protein GF329_17225 [Candidatus Lokiarchaeota archaeon]|nr:hypothetical protein [Candidatus Lokiarchaeota archaeon]